MHSECLKTRLYPSGMPFTKHKEKRLLLLYSPPKITSWREMSGLLIWTFYPRRSQTWMGENKFSSENLILWEGKLNEAW